MFDNCQVIEGSCGGFKLDTTGGFVHFVTDVHLENADFLKQHLVDFVL